MERRPTEALCVDLELLEPGTHELDVELTQAWAAEVLSETDAVADRGGSTTLELTLQADRTLLVRGRIELIYTVPCARCLEGAVVDVGAETGELCVTFVPAERLRSWAEAAGTGRGADATNAASDTDDDIEPLEPNELDEIGYEGTKVDLRGFVVEQVLLAYPMRALCSRGEACLGLCMRCGVNLNEVVEAPGRAPERCPACGTRLDGVDDESAESPWKKALAKVKPEVDGN
jgi:uncharacterized metal-binding protein YceD (DUF177 family)